MGPPWDNSELDPLAVQVGLVFSKKNYTELYLLHFDNQLYIKIIFGDVVFIYSVVRFRSFDPDYFIFTLTKQHQEVEDGIDLKTKTFGLSAIAIFNRR